MRERYVFSGLAAILAGIGGWVVAVSYALQPPEQRVPTDVIRFLQSFAHHSLAREISYAAFAIAALFGLAVIPALYRELKEDRPGFYQWTGGLAFLGFAVTAVGNLRALTFKPYMAGVLSSSADGAKGFLAWIDPLLAMDPWGWLGGAGVGLWMIASSVIAMRRELLSLPHGLIGILAGLCYCLSSLATAVGNTNLSQILAPLALILLAPVWYVWLGVRMIRQSAYRAVPVPVLKG